MAATSKIDFTADDAREIFNTKMQKDLDRVLEMLRKKVENAKRPECYIDSLSDCDISYILSELEKRGFKATYKNDQREGDYIHVSWK